MKKAPGFLVRREDPFNGGPPLEELARDLVTPTPLFFVRSHGTVPVVDASAFRLQVEGAVNRPLSLSLEDLARGFERVRLPATLQCAGLRRDELITVAEVGGELPWSGDAIGNAVWSGVRLADVLAAAGAAGDGSGAHVSFVGLDRIAKEGSIIPFGASIPSHKARSPEVLLADAMNGSPLPGVHGGPLRLVVPGYIAARSVKWLGEVRVQAEPSANYYQQRSYRLHQVGPGVPSANDRGEMLTDLRLNSAITSPAPGTRLRSGPFEVRGWALAAGEAQVERVELSADGGLTWREARFTDDGASPWSWRLWRAEAETVSGSALLVVRAFDSAGECQPDDLLAVWNPKGYMNNAWHRVPVQVVHDAAHRGDAS
jgi:sulfite oxidase